jgi:2-methylcitrate dehydratase
MALHPQVKDRIGEIERIVLETQEAGVRIIDKTGPLANYADRDHCLQYMVAVPLIFGRLTADDYADAVAADPRIDALRELMEVQQNPRFTQDYLDPGKRYIGNAVQVFFKGGGRTDRISIDFPLGHRNRRAEGLPLLLAKCEAALRSRLAAAQVDGIMALAAEPLRFDALPVDAFMNMYRP